MNRREALALMTTLCGGTIFGAKQMLAGIVNANTSERALTAAELSLLNQIGETILPTTAGSAGAKAADVAGFMQIIIRDFYQEKERATFLAGPALLEESCRARHAGRGFMDLKAVEQHDLLMTLEQTKPQPEYYKMIKQLTVWGYYSSEVGATQALINVPVPGRYEGCITIGPGAKAYSG